MYFNLYGCKVYILLINSNSNLKKKKKKKKKKCCVKIYFIKIYQ